MNNRLKTLQKIIVKEKLGSLLVSKPENISYLTNYPLESLFDSDTHLLVKPRSTCLIHSSLSKFRSKKSINKVAFSSKNPILTIIKNLTTKQVCVESSFLSYSQLNSLKYAIKPVKVKTKNNLIEELRQIKNTQEILLIKKSCHIASKVMKWIKPQIQPGKTEKQITYLIVKKIFKLNACTNFSPIVAAGSHSSIPHHVPTNKKIRKCDTVLIDLGCTYNDYNSDVSRTFFIGKTSTLQRKISQTVMAAYKSAIRSLTTKVLNSTTKIDHHVRTTIRTAGFGDFFPHATGHGIGLETHELPSINGRGHELIKSNMTFTIEPAIYLPGKFGYRYENTILTTNEKPITLT